MKNFRIGILGSGNMGRSLGLRWMEQGYEVQFGSAFDHELKLVTARNASVQTGTLSAEARHDKPTF